MRPSKRKHQISRRKLLQLMKSKYSLLLILLLLILTQGAFLIKSAKKAPKEVTKLDVISAATTGFTIKSLLIGYIPPSGVKAVYPNAMISNVADATKNRIFPQLSNNTRYLGYKDSSAPPSLHYTLADNDIHIENNPPPLPGDTTGGINAIFSKYNICNYAVANDIKMVIIWTAGSDQYKGYDFESAVTGSKGITTNGPHLNNCASKTILVMNFNYERDMPQAVESYGHHLEDVFQKFRPEFSKYMDTAASGAYTSNPKYFPPQTTGNDSCGTFHNPPNATKEYDSRNTTNFISDCRNWKPDGSGIKETINCSAWGCSQIGWEKFWMQNIPGANNTLYNGSIKIPNWWVYIGDPDNCINNPLGCSSSIPSVQAITCKSLTASSSTLNSAPITLTAQANTSASQVYYLYYNRDNIDSTGTMRFLSASRTQPYFITNAVSGSTTSTTLKFSDIDFIDKEDLYAPQNKKATHIRILAFFATSDGVISNYSPSCAVDINTSLNESWNITTQSVCPSGNIVKAALFSAGYSVFPYSGLPSWQNMQVNTPVTISSYNFNQHISIYGKYGNTYLYADSVTPQPPYSILIRPPLPLFEQSGSAFWQRDLTGSNYIFKYKLPSNTPECAIATPAPTQVSQVISPNGGETWQIGTTHSVSWRFTPPAGVTISYPLNTKVAILSVNADGSGGTVYSIVAKTIVAGLNSTNITIPASVPTGSNYKILVQIESLIQNNYPNDESDNKFTITGAPQITSPIPSATTTTTMPNLLKNGSFEYDSNNDTHPDYWNANSYVSRSNIIVEKGLYSLLHQSNSIVGYDSYQNSFNITPGKQYTFSGKSYIYSLNPGASYSIYMRWYNSSDILLRKDLVKTYTVNTSTWDKVLKSVLAPANTYRGQIRMELRNFTGKIYADDFDFKQS
jgi:hypothetical protein